MKVFTKLVLIILSQIIIVQIKAGNQDDDQTQKNFLDDNNRKKYLGYDLDDNNRKKDLGYDLDDNWFEKVVKNRKHSEKRGNKIDCFSCLGSMTNSCEDPFNEDGVNIDSECEVCQKIKYIGFEGPDIWRGCPHGSDKTRWNEEYRYICSTPLCNCSHTNLHNLHLTLISIVIFLQFF